MEKRFKRKILKSPRVGDHIWYISDTSKFTLFAIIALFDGLKIDDKYPGYGAIVRKLKIAQEELHSEVDELKDSSSAYADQYLDEGDRERRRLNQEAIALRENHDFTR